MSQLASRWNPPVHSEYRLVPILGFVVVALSVCALTAALGYYVIFPPTLAGKGGFAPVATTPRETNPRSDPVWDRIQRNGKIVVGIAIQHAPYAYIGEDLSLDGYDVAMAKEIGRRLGYPPEFVTLTFDGLLSAVQAGKVDMALSAIAVTPERRALVDFSSVYHIDEDVVLYNTAAPVEVRRLDDLLRYRVGVRQGSEHQAWLQNKLVLPGLMPPQNLVAYPTTAELIDVLAGAASPVSVAVIDNLSAQAAISGKPLAVAARGLNPQSYAIALAKEAPIFLTLIDIELNQMRKDGTLARLEAQYLGQQPGQPTLPVLPPTAPRPTMPPPTAPLPTAPPIPSVTPPPACVDGMQFISDLNYIDNNMRNPVQVGPNQEIQKRWRIRNTGTCTWDSSYVLGYAGSNPQHATGGGRPTALQATVPPGQIYDISAGFVTPGQPGPYQSFWVLRNARGENVGARLWAGVIVVSQVTPTPGANLPVIYSFSSTPDHIVASQCVTLHWHFDGRNLALTRLFHGDKVILQDMPGAGEFQDCPGQAGAHTYRLVIDAQFGGSVSASQVVEVVAAPPPPPAPVIQYFTVDQSEIAQGACVNLSWAYTGDSPATLYRNHTPLTAEAAVSGLWQDCPPITGPIIYRLQAGAATRVVYVTVLQTFP